MKCLVMIPAYNEEKNIYNVVKSIQDMGKEFNVIVINDGSADRTFEEAKRAGAKVLNLTNNLGIGGAVQTGYLYAYYHNYDTAVQVDGDGQHNSIYLKKLLEALRSDEGDMIIGSRFVDKIDHNYKASFIRSIGIHYFSRLVSYLCKAPYYDTTSGYRMVNKKGIELFAGYYPQDYPEVETIVYAVRNGLRVKEVKVNMRKRQEGKSSITAFKSLYYIIW